MTQQHGVMVSEPLKQQQQQDHHHHQHQHHTNTEISGTQQRKHEERQLAGVLRVINAAEAAHHHQPDGNEDEGFSKETLAWLSPEQQSTLLRRAISKLSDRGDGRSVSGI